MKKELICFFVFVLFLIPFINAKNLNENSNVKKFELIVEEIPPINLKGFILNDIVTIQDMLNAYQDYKRNEVSLLYFLDKLRNWIVFILPSEEPINDTPTEPGDYDWIYVDLSNRIINWSYAGIPGGIPYRTVICQTLYPGASASDISTAIQNCPENQVVYLAEGNYLLNTITLTNPRNVTLRGAGAGKAILNFSGEGIRVSAGSYIPASSSQWTVTRSIASGYTKSSTSITLAEDPAAVFAVGNLIQITQDDDYNLVFHREGNWAGTKNLRFTSRITAVNGRTITLATPIPYSYSANLNPICTAMAPGSVFFGIEDMTINVNNNNGITIGGGDRCWVKGVEMSGIANSGILFWASSQCEARRNYIHDAYNFPSQSDGYANMLQYGNSYCRIEDSITYKVAIGVLMNGAAANAILYNFDWYNGRAGLLWVSTSINCNHGPHGIMNLFEGNIGARFQNDAYHGSTSHGTLLRNSFNGLHPEYTNERQIIDLARASYYHNLIGNVLGDSSWTPNAYEMIGSVGHDYSCIYQLGYPNPDNTHLTPGVVWTNWNRESPDSLVASTLLRHGNYDYYNRNTVWDSNISSHEIPNSLIYNSKPDWFGSLSWPPIGPDVENYVNSIPAKARWDAYVISGNISNLF